MCRLKLQAITCTIVIFGMFSGQRSTLGNMAWVASPVCGTVMMAWIWHVWINAIVFVPTAKAPPKAGAKKMSYNSLNLAYSGQHPCFGPNWFIQFCHATRGDEYGMPRKTLARKQAKIDTGHIWTSVFFCCHASNSQDSPKAGPRVIFNWKNIIEQLRLEWMLIERWGRQGMFNVPTSMWQDCSFNSLNLAYSGQHPCFGPNWFIQFCHMWRWIRYA